MAQDCPFGPDIHVKRKIEPTKGLSLWFADVPEGGITENTYLSACASSSFVIGPSGDLADIPVFASALFSVAQFRRKGRSSTSNHTFTLSLPKISRY